MQGRTYIRTIRKKISFVVKENKQKKNPTLPLHCEYRKSNPPSENSYPLTVSHIHSL